jgi:CheY-like chemotaxis protein
MEILKALELFEKLECKMADMYLKLHEENKINKELSEFFYNMYLEEVAHAQLIRMERRIVQSSPKEFAEPNINLPEVHLLMDEIDCLMKHTLPMIRLIDKLYTIECLLSETHFYDAIKDSNPDLQEFLMQLGDTSAAHIEKIAAFAVRHGVKTEAIQNRRMRKPRVSYTERVEINGEIAVKGVDLSEGGMFLLTGREYPAGVIIDLEFPVLQEIVAVKATVQFSIESVGMGVRFVELPNDAHQAIMRYVVNHNALATTERLPLLFVSVDAGSAPHHSRMYMNHFVGAGHRVIEISNFEEALHLLRRGTEVSCIIITIEAEDDKNDKLLTYLRSNDRYRRVPVFVLTGNAHPDFRKNLIRRGATKILNRLTSSPKRIVEEIHALAS